MSDPTPIYPQAVAYLASVVRELHVNGTASFVKPERLLVAMGSDSVPIPFPRSTLEDLEKALEGGQPVSYTNGLKSDARFDLYYALANDGLLPQGFKFSDFFLSVPERDWQRNIGLQAQFPAEFAKGLYERLKRLEFALERTFKAGLPEAEGELVAIQHLTSHYKKHGHLNLQARAQQLAYLKAAGVVWILDLEREKDAEPVPRLKTNYTKRILDIALPFQATPWKRMKLPEALTDYIARENEAVDSSQRGLQQHTDIESLLERQDSRLRERWVGSWATLRSDNPDAVSQAANSMVEVLDAVISQVVGAQEFRVYLDARYPGQAEMTAAMRHWISLVKDGLHAAKHHTEAQAPQLAEDLMHATELIVRILLR